MLNKKIKSKAEIRAEKLLPGNQNFTTITDDIAGVPEEKKTPIQWWLLFGLALSLLAIFGCLASQEESKLKGRTIAAEATEMMVLLFSGETQ